MKNVEEELIKPVNLYKQVEGVLFAYGTLEYQVKSCQLKIKELKDKGQEERISKLKDKVKDYKALEKAIDNAMEYLKADNETSEYIIRSIYFDRRSFEEVAEQLGIDKLEVIRRRRRIIVNKLIRLLA